MSDEPELLPCPFCGGKPTMQKWQDGFDPPNVSWLVKCSGGCLASCGLLEEEQSDAAEAWNRRAPAQ